VRFNALFWFSQLLGECARSRGQGEAGQWPISPVKLAHHPLCVRPFQWAVNQSCKVSLEYASSSCNLAICWRKQLDNHEFICAARLVYAAFTSSSGQCILLALYQYSQIALRVGTRSLPPTSTNDGPPLLLYRPQICYHHLSPSQSTVLRNFSCPPVSPSAVSSPIRLPPKCWVL
jgi:hypothetical protein